MRELNALFRERIGLPANAPLTFETLDSVLEGAAIHIPFENLSIMEKNIKEITKENLTNKLLINHEGGMCYELNSLLYFFLLENGFKAALTRGVVYKNGQFLTLGRTHVTILLDHMGQTYLVDTGFGGNLPLKPVPLNGETVASNNGEFRVKKMDSEHGNYVFEMKLKHKDTDWRIGYAFNSKNPVTDVSEFNEIQAIVAGHDQSPFNKAALLTRLTQDGNITLTPTSFTQWVDGVVTREEIDGSRFKELAKQHFGIGH